MRKIILIVHTSLDGFVAGEHGEFDGFTAGPDNLAFVNNLTEDADGALAGRISFQMLDSYWPTAREKENASPEEIKYSNWYNLAHKIIISDPWREGSCQTQL